MHFQVQFFALKLVMFMGRKRACIGALHGLLVVVVAVVFIMVGVGAVVVPNSTCYALDDSGHIHDFSNLIGQLFEYERNKNHLISFKEPDLAVRFCKDVESRSQQGYVSFGRFDKFNQFFASSGRGNFTQGYYEGDLKDCESSFDKLGRTSQINIFCGSCPDGKCAGGLGCICSVANESTCCVTLDLAIPCAEPGPRVFEGFTVGFHPRSWEIVYNGMTQAGYEKPSDEFSFSTEQRDVILYLTAISAFSDLVQAPIIKISPDKGLDVRLSGSGAKGNRPTTLSPTVILVHWTCKKVLDTPYSVEITIPVKNYDPIQFTFAKMCAQTQEGGGEATRGWAIFGILSCILIIASTLFCCGGFVYRSRIQHLHGLDAIPGMALLSACLETASGSTYTRTQMDDTINPFMTVERQGATTQARRTSGGTYGSI